MPKEKTKEKKNRGKDFSTSEKLLLINEVRQNYEVLFSAFSGYVGNKDKREQWTRISEHLTALGIEQRNWIQCREKWSKLRSGAIARRRVKNTETGNRPVEYVDEKGKTKRMTREEWEIDDLVLQAIGENGPLASGLKGNILLSIIRLIRWCVGMLSDL